ncbi:MULTISPECIES: (2Fe-2S)-binding protein [unclassified Streptomyces]|uniref:(2Fe-2S)-binding protein n=1 Tax=unclassified Streptomyces TaxID=2593676 RepID=UPI0022537EBC|nr:MULTISPECIES: (2Fe-2S)-binding protein [unclassified Streptomyces]WSP54616.1 (2Fe-2S)-binding protein [Streptomyces sp. NBC_01241]WSU24707.1 (2Fe-2S)-binding protein [Streptomyces sp. NBC_01108]MCX4786169.1 (2Fe-2S)-binding protein [Streptomyces sp. NBC_01221]MCX4797974.1 (2Fe-2S)-binding protein [Streptomyces sp. NBC_01242]WSJ39241.1 (2Fe-2S)-binding protein [Streptomyces sp. NBC_01321]
MYVCSCFGITEKQVKEHADAGACTPRQIASACKAGTDCGGCVRAIQAVLGRGACPRRELLDRKRTPRTTGDAGTGSAPEAAPGIDPGDVPGVTPGIRLSEAA